MASRRSHRAPTNEADLGLIFVDYDNLFQTLAQRTTAGEQPHRFLLAMVSELRRYLQDELGVRTVRVLAYGDFSGHEVDAGVIMNDLAAAGVEARHVARASADTDALLALTIDAAEHRVSRPDIGAFVVLSGSNWFVPLVQHLQHYGKFVLVASIDLPPALASLQGTVADAYLNARFLLDARTRDALQDARPPDGSFVSAVGVSVQERAPKEVTEVADEGARHALEVIEEFFGQYEEVYLTPLLRKLTDTLENEDGEPKDLVSILQDAGAVWLEKRRGFPYDYTVLLVNADHPDVQRVREDFASYQGDGSADADDDDYEEDDGFDDDYDEAS